MWEGEDPTGICMPQNVREREKTMLKKNNQPNIEGVSRIATMQASRLYLASIKKLNCRHQPPLLLIFLLFSFFASFHRSAFPARTLQLCCTSPLALSAATLLRAPCSQLKASVHSVHPSSGSRGPILHAHAQFLLLIGCYPCYCATFSGGTTPIKAKRAW